MDSDKSIAVMAARAELKISLEEWKDAGAPTFHVIEAVQELVYAILDLEKSLENE